jgi:hypothetical protein
MGFSEVLAKHSRLVSSEASSDGKIETGDDHSRHLLSCSMILHAGDVADNQEKV